MDNIIGSIMMLVICAFTSIFAVMLVLPDAFTALLQHI